MTEMYHEKVWWLVGLSICRMQRCILLVLVVARDTMNNFYQKIIDENNIREAYFDIVVRFEKSQKTNSYQGVDGRTLRSYDIHALETISQVREDLLSKKSVTPALEMNIPKRTKLGTRTIYLHTVRERVRAQAIYRILEPYFDSYFSKYLFSYRTSHPHYRAIKSVVKRYHQKRKDDYVLVGDISSYSDIINPDILLKKIKELEFDKDTNELLQQYIEAGFFRNGRYQKSEKGIVTGLPVTVLFNNLYLDEFDKFFGEQSGMYRRVGDDFIAFGTKQELVDIQGKMEAFLEKIAIKKESQKIHIVELNEKFEFLGFEFDKGVISIPPISIKKIQKKIRHLLRYRDFPTQEDRIEAFSKLLFNGRNSVRNYFIELIKHYNHVNNHDQVAWLSQYLFVRVTIFFFQKYSYRNWRKTKKLVAGITIPSLLRYYRVFQSGTMRGDTFNDII